MSIMDSVEPNFREMESAEVSFREEMLGLKGRLVGYLPVSGYGTVYGVEFEFRADGDRWLFEVRGCGCKTCLSGNGPPDYPRREGLYSERAVDAGRMPLEEALAIIKLCARWLRTWPHIRAVGIGE